MSSTAPQAALSLPRRLALIIEGLCAVLTARCVEDRTVVPVLFLAWVRLRRLVARFEALVEDVRAGRVLAAPRLGAPSLPQMPGLPAWEQPYRLPRGFGWLLRLAPESAAYAGQVEHLLADPEMMALLAEEPQAGRILRPLCRMLGMRLQPEVSASRPGAPVSSHDDADLCFALAVDGRPLNVATGDISPALPLTSVSEPWTPPRREPELPAGTPADPAADPPLNVPWRRPAPG